MKKQKLSRLGNLILRLFLNGEDFYQLSGDLEESYRMNSREKGPAAARMWYWLQLLKSLPTFIDSSIKRSITMFKNNLKIALRNIIKYKGYSFINILGLTLGITCCILIMFWVYNEWSYNRFHEKKNEIFRVYDEVVYSNGQTRLSAASHYPLKNFIKSNCPDVLEAVRFATRSRNIRYGEDVFQENAGFADSGFLEMFTFSLIEGDPATALSEPFSIVISEEVSRKFFGTESSLGKILKMNSTNSFDAKVTGVFKQIPKESDLQFSVLLPFRLIQWPNNVDENGWGGNPLETYVLLNKNSSYREVAEKLTAALESTFSDHDVKLHMHFQPLTKMHLHTLDGGGLITYLVIMSVVAGFILLIACINFMNLSTARAANRAREVGIRKVAGARKSDIVRQFFSESVIMSLLALLLSVCLVGLLLPVFNIISGKQLTLSDACHFQIYLGLIGIALFTGLLSGSYPALFLSSFQPVKVLKGTFRTGSKHSLLRKVLVVSQFALSIFLLIGTIIIYQQLGFIKEKDLGYEKENVIVSVMRNEIRANYSAFKNELLQHANVLHVSWASESPSYVGSSVSAVEWDGKNPDELISMNWQYVDYDYIETMNFEIIEGRSFSSNFSTDTSNAYIINEEAAKVMEMESPVGKRLSVFRNEGTIVGVVKNFHFQPLRNEIKPYVMMLGGMNWSFVMFIKIGSENVEGTVNYIENVFKKFSSSSTISYIFLNELINTHYQTEERLKNIIGCFSILAVLISCLGLLGLASFMAQQRTKEIGVRKVLGASSTGIVFMLSREFTKWVLISNIIAWPAAYFAVKKMLQNYAYRTDIMFWVFILSGASALIIALFTVSYQAFKAARTNPVDSLKYE